MNKIAVFTDIHGNLQALQAILEDIKKEKINDVICLGDVIGIGPNSKETLQLIRENNIELILGNHEIYFLNQFKNNEILEAGSKHIEHHKWVASLLDDDDRAFLANCKLLKKVENKEIILSHFFFKENIKEGEYPFCEIDIRQDKNRKDKRIPNMEKYNLFGHIHQKCYFEKGENKYYCLGSSGCTHDDYTFYNIVTIENEDIEIKEKRVKFDRLKFEQTMMSIEYPEKVEIYERFFL